MAAYFTAPRRHAPLVLTSPEQRSPRNQDDSFDLTESTPTYVFPNPSSAPPSPSPSHFSILSERSDISASLISFSEFDSPETSPVIIQREYYPARQTSRQFVNILASPLNSWADVQGPSLNLSNSPRWDSNPHDDARIEAFHQQPRKKTTGIAPNGESVSISATSVNSLATGTAFCHPLVRSSTSLPSLILDKEEQLRSLIQQRHSLLRETTLFSFLSYLLGADESTLDLLVEPTSSASIIFPINTRLNTDETEVFTAPHGFEKLFSAIATEKGHQAIQRGIRFFGDISSSETDPVPFPSIWIVVTGILSNGYTLFNKLSSNLTRGMNQ